MDRTEPEVYETIGHLFRDHSGRMVAFLCRSFGLGKIDTVEDAVQDALIAAMKTWPYSGIPSNQFAWLLRSARNRCIDILRRDNRTFSVDADFDIVNSDTAGNLSYFSREIDEDQLQMIFACCHPDISSDSRVALTLKTVGGFSVGEIANAFLSNTESVAKLLSRAKLKLRNLDVRMEMPSPNELAARLDSVLKVVYLIFNEGYSATTGDDLIRKDLVFEAIRLARSLAKHPVTASPTVDALTALFCFQAARMPARSGGNGELFILSEQDRSKWDTELLTLGVHHLRLSANGDSISEYHLEAEIAAVYTLAASFESTDWNRILVGYEKLQKRRFSPIVELNRNIVVSKILGPQIAYEKLIELENQLSNYYLFYVTKAHYESLLDDAKSAHDSLLKASEFSTSRAASQFIQQKLQSNSPPQH